MYTWAVRSSLPPSTFQLNTAAYDSSPWYLHSQVCDSFYPERQTFPSRFANHQSHLGPASVNMDTNAGQRNKLGGVIADQDRYCQMCERGVEEQVEELPYAGVNNEDLDLISCVQLDNIDVDNIDAHHACGGASAATFFEPSGPIDDDMKDLLSPHWFDLGEGQAPQVYPEYRAGWFLNPWDKVAPVGRDELVIERFGGSAWWFMEYVSSPTSSDFCLYSMSLLADMMAFDSDATGRTSKKPPACCCHTGS